MHKIKIIAPKYLIEPLAILGIEIYPADSESEAKLSLERATEKKEPALIFFSERLAVDLGFEIEKLNKNPDINVVLIPDNRGSVGFAASQLQALVRNSIGAEVITRK
jgi:vacuolar-type H+-ATPase subunit F/Vma7